MGKVDTRNGERPRPHRIIVPLPQPKAEDVGDGNNKAGLTKQYSPFALVEEKAGDGVRRRRFVNIGTAVDRCCGE